MSDSEFPQIRPLHEPRRVGPTSELPPRRRRFGDKRMLAGIGAACALGLVGGFFMKPNLDDQPAMKRVNARTAEIPKEPDWLDIQVDRSPPPEPVVPLSPPAPYTAPMEGYTPQPVQPAPAPQPATQPRVVNGAVMRPYTDVAREQARAPTPRQAARPSFNCRYARTPSEKLVCTDPNLAAADRRLARAYQQAVSSGVPERLLRRQQDEWLAARETAARYGPEDVERVYEARISELQQMR